MTEVTREEEWLHKNFGSTEKPSKLSRYALYTFMSASVGLLVGSLVNSTVEKVQGPGTSRANCAAYAAANVAVTVSIFLLLNTYVFFRGTKVTFNDWLWNTSAGFLCVSMYFVTQDKLAKNINCFTKYA